MDMKVRDYLKYYAKREDFAVLYDSMDEDNPLIIVWVDKKGTCVDCLDEYLLECEVESYGAASVNLGKFVDKRFPNSNTVGVTISCATIYYSR